MTRPPIPRRPMTEDELTMARAVMPGRVSYLPGAPDKRFASQISHSTEITEGQASYLHRLVHRYRRQIPLHVVALVDLSVANARPRTSPPPREPRPAKPAAPDPQLTFEFQT